MGRFATGISVITCRDGAGGLHGMTANSLTSVSLAPPMLLICVDHNAALRAPLLDIGSFTVNILEQHQEALSRRFSGKHEDRFDGVGFTTGQLGHPVLDGVMAHAECVIESVVEAGDHSIVIARVIAGAAQDGRPLLYFRGGYASLA
jgi:flavin reductase (DIM6/NTAB) family NADH-FMN oxidoreductase RutF